MKVRPIPLDLASESRRGGMLWILEEDLFTTGDEEESDGPPLKAQDTRASPGKLLTKTAKAAATAAKMSDKAAANAPVSNGFIPRLCFLLLLSPDVIDHDNDIENEIGQGTDMLKTLSLMENYKEKHGILGSWGFNKALEDGKAGNSNTPSFRRFITGELRHLCEDESGELANWAAQALAGYDAKAGKVTGKIMIGCKWVSTKVMRDELGRPRSHFWFARIQLAAKKHDELRAALGSETPLRSLRTLDMDGSSGWPSEGLFLPLPILTALMKNLPQLFADYKDVTSRMEDVITAHPEQVAQLASYARGRGSKYYTTTADTEESGTYQ